jgi:hypothetical protein
MSRLWKAIRIFKVNFNLWVHWKLEFRKALDAYVDKPTQFNHDKLIETQKKIKRVEKLLGVEY